MPYRRRYHRRGKRQRAHKRRQIKLVASFLAILVAAIYFPGAVLNYFLWPKILKIAGYMMLASALAAVAVHATDIPALVRKAKPAVVEILTYDRQNKLLKTGTGFFVSADGVLLTNYHVISGRNLLQPCEWCDAEPVLILAQTPAGAAYFFKSIVPDSETDDIAELQFSATDVPYLTLGSSSSAVEGQHVLVIGNPEGLEGTVSDGIISAFRSGRTMIQITAPISPGSSGSPVLDESGNVIGIATQVFREGQNLNLAISAETISRCDSWRRLRPVDPRKPQLGAAVLLARARSLPPWAIR